MLKLSPGRATVSSKTRARESGPRVPVRSLGSEEGRGWVVATVTCVWPSRGRMAGRPVGALVCCEGIAVFECASSAGVRVRCVLRRLLLLLLMLLSAFEADSRAFGW